MKWPADISQHISSKTDTASPCPISNFHLHFACVAFGAEPLNFSKFVSVACVWHVCLQVTWKNQRPGSSTLQIHLWLLLPNSHMILLGSSFRLLINWIKNTQQALYHFHSTCALRTCNYVEVGGYQHELPPFPTTVLMELVICLKLNHRTSDTLKNSHSLQNSSLSWDR